MRRGYREHHQKWRQRWELHLYKPRNARLSATARNYGEAWEDVLCNLQRSMTLFQPSQLLENMCILY
jgi:hypothetical protein